MCVFLCVECCILFYLSCVLYHQDTKKYGERWMQYYECILCILCVERRQGRVACITAGGSVIELQTPLVWEVKYSDSSGTCYQQSGKYDQFLVLRGGAGQVCWIQTHE